MSCLDNNSKNVLKNLSSLDEYSQIGKVRIFSKVPEDEN
jgi:hypothetical protein